MFYPTSGESISLGDNGVCKVTGTGTVIVNRLVNQNWSEARIENVLYVPKLRKNLFFVGVCTSKGYNVVFRGQTVTVERNSEIFATAIKQENNIYRMFFKAKNSRENSEVNVSSTNLRVWHERMGHVNNKVLREMT